jgi:outer membrane protein OmpA-like peptidoglycan-associated protein
MQSTWTGVRSGRALSAGAWLGLLLSPLLLFAPDAHAQAAPGASAAATQPGGPHLLLGGFYGQFRVDTPRERQDLFGARAGIGFGELIALTGFYWRGLERDADESVRDGWGGELQLNLNAGYGVAPFIVGGAARVTMSDRADQSALVAGGGLMLPLGPLLVHAAVRDYMFGIDRLANADSPETVTHNWLYSVGGTIAIGGRRDRPAVVAVPTAPTPAAPTPVAAPPTALAPAVPAAAVDTLTGAAVSVDYRSTTSIEVPIPREGMIVLRYGPEQGTTVVTPGAVAPGVVQAAPPAAAAPAPTAAATAPLTDTQLDAIVQRVLAGVNTTVLPQIELQRQLLAALREEVRLSQTQPGDAVRAEIAALTRSLATQQAMLQQLLQQPVQTAPQQPVAQSPLPPAAYPAPAAGRAADLAAAERAAAEAAAARAAAERELAALTAAQQPAAAAPDPMPSLAAPAAAPTADVAAIRLDMAAIVLRHTALLTASETERGPAFVLSDGAFDTGGVLVTPAARPAIADVAGLLNDAAAGHRIYVHGHSDGSLTELQAQRQSELRAEAVRSVLVQQGVAPARIHAIGYGAGRPAADNATSAGRALNRRVEIVVGECCIAEPDANGRNR